MPPFPFKRQDAALNGNQIEYIEADLNTTSSFYDGGQLTAQSVYQDGGPTINNSWGYNLSGQQTSMTDGDLHVTSSSYDPAGNLTSQAVYASSSASEAFSSETWKYDGDNNVTSDIVTVGIDTLGSTSNTTLSSYDDGELTTQVYTLGSANPVTATGGYDKAGNVTSQQDIQGYVTSSTYDDDLLVKQVVTGPNGSTVVDSQTWKYVIVR